MNSSISISIFLKATISPLLVAFALQMSLTSCGSPTRVTYAPHRTNASQLEIGTVVNSYPVRITKNSGIGSVVGGVGGAVIGHQIGSGGGRAVSSFLGHFVGVFGGAKAESSLREKNAQEITVKVKQRYFNIISKDQHRMLKKGDRVLVLQNVYGHPISVKLMP